MSVDRKRSESIYVERLLQVGDLFLELLAQLSGLGAAVRREELIR